MTSGPDKLVLVTGGSGFLALHCIAQALARDYRVRTTVRSDKKKDSVLQALVNANPQIDIPRLSFVYADLLKDDGWAEAVEGVSLILHVASPFPNVQPEDENEVIRPAVDGTLRILKFAKASGTVKRIVLTSSAVAISYGTKYENGKVFNENDWSDPDGKGSYITPYAKSKTLAEKAAWKFMELEGGQMELTVVNPVGIFGPPLLLPNESTTCGIIKDMLQGKYPAVPNIQFGVVDVRDVASLHLLVATKDGAKGQRYLCVAGDSISLVNIGGLLRSGLGSKATKAPTRALPDVLVRLLSYLMPSLKSAIPELGTQKEFSNLKARELGWNPRSNEEAIVSCGQAFIDAEIC
jgi:dihydroflavonol-4-reductase